MQATGALASEILPSVETGLAEAADGRVALQVDGRSCKIQNLVVSPGTSDDPHSSIAHLEIHQIGTILK